MPSKYDYQHKKRRERERRRVEAGVADCWRCGKAILPGSEWHLGHNEATGKVEGAEHARCNLVAAAEMTNATKAVDLCSRHWENGNGYDESCPDCRELGRACPVGAE